MQGRVRKASGFFNEPTLAAEARFAGVRRRHLLLERKPNLDRMELRTLSASRLLRSPSGFVNLMFPPSITRDTAGQ